MDHYSFLNGIHPEYFTILYDKYLQSPDAVEPSWRSFFQGYDFANEHYDSDIAKQIPKAIQKEFKVVNLINAYRKKGHLFTKTNPVRERRKYTPNLAIENFGLSNADLQEVFGAAAILGLKFASLEEIIKHLQKIYCDSIGVEYMYIPDFEQIKWWQENLNKNENHPDYDKNAKKYIFKKLAEAVIFEDFLQTKFIGQKRFSLEGNDTLIPAIAMAMRKASEYFNTKECVLGMAHRGRLNTLVNVFRKPLKDLFCEFEGKDFEEKNIDGDVKYHMGYTRKKTYRNGNEIMMNLLPNPSHLEAVGPLVAGITRAKIDKKYKGDSSKLLPMIVHGDAAVSGQGVVYETVQMSGLNGYKIGGTLHIVVNNQIGFTTNYLDGRSSIYCTDVAKVTLSPVLHVNADDVEAVCHAVELALQYRNTFKKDVFIDLLGYRKYGHNEGDEPRFTQPKLYKAIGKHPNPKEIYLKNLISQNILNEEEAKEIQENYKQLLETKYNESKKESCTKVSIFMKDIWQDFSYGNLPKMLAKQDTSYSEEHLKNIAKIIATIPKNVQFVRKAERILKGRAKMAFELNKMDWGMAEMLAYGSLMEEGYDIRISGQDVERGTFSHRHAILRDALSEERINLLNTNPKNKGNMEIYNSPLSEYGVLGFDYGYALSNPNTLTIWEAQFGDFSNGGQIVFDQYISAAESKWKIQNGLVVLLPHGYEGQGSEHSSARIERYLQLCSLDNMIVANCTTPANMYHLLRRHMKRNFRKPLVVFTPKSLLRHPLAVSNFEEFSKGTFQEVIDDENTHKKQVQKLVFCSGKFYYDLIAEREKRKAKNIAFIRIEQLFPLHKEKIENITNKYPNVKQYIWGQEEPKNMGAWSYILQRFDWRNLKVVSRNYHASPASGSNARFKKRHNEVLEKIFEI